MQSTSTNIAVAVRMRPLLSSQLRAGHSSEKLIIDQKREEVKFFNEKFKQYKAFKFDKVFGMNSCQEDIFQQTQIPLLLHKVVEGYHATIFAYGQTGSGKTYSMEGYRYEMMDQKSAKPYLDVSKDQSQDQQNLGIIPRAVQELFQDIKRSQSQNLRKFQVHCSYLQIYQEKIYDLLNTFQYSAKALQSESLKLRWNKQDDFVVQNLYTFECKSAQEVMDLLHIGIRNKVLAAHRLNNTSSRSHCILTLTVESYDPNNPHSIISSKLHLVDLAGSERTSQTGAQGRVQKQRQVSIHISIDINKSLFTLRSVIVSLAQRNNEIGLNSKSAGTYVPYRDSKLTSILRQSLGGNSYSLMVACISPSDEFFDQNISTLTYATKAAYIANKPIKNEDPRLRLIKQLKNEVASLNKELESANEYIQFLCSMTGEQMKIFGDSKKKGSMPSFAQEQSRRGHTISFPSSSELPVLQRAVTANVQVVNPLQILPSPQHATMNIESSVQSQRPQTSTNINIFMPNGTQSNFKSSSTFVAQKSKGLQNIANRITQQPDYVSERLIEAVQMVKEVLQSNIILRDNITKLQREVEKLNSELFGLQCENDEVRDRLQVMETIAGKDAPSLFEFREDPGSGQMDLANEFLKLKKEKRALELRLRHMELDRIRMQQHSSGRKSDTRRKNKDYDQEPVRPALEEQLQEARHSNSRERNMNAAMHKTQSSHRVTRTASKSRLEVNMSEVKVTPRSGANFMLPPQPTRGSKSALRKEQTNEYFNNTLASGNILEVHSNNKQFRRTAGVFNLNKKMPKKGTDLDFQIFNQDIANLNEYADNIFRVATAGVRENSLEKMNRSFTQLDEDPLSPFHRNSMAGNSRDPEGQTQLGFFPPTSGTPQPRKSTSQQAKKNKLNPKTRFSNPDKRKGQQQSFQNQSPRGTFQAANTSTNWRVVENEDIFRPSGMKSIKRKMKTVTNQSLPNSLQDELDKPYTPPTLPIIDEH